MNLSMRWNSRSVRLLLPAAALAAATLVFAAKPIPFLSELLVSDGSLPAESADPNLRNPMGLASSPTGPWMVASNGSSMAVSYDGDGLVQSAPVDVPGAPTGIVYNAGAGFLTTDGVTSAPSQFLFASEDGTISGYSPLVPAPGPSAEAFVVIDRSDTGAVYTGIAVATTIAGDRLYVADFANARIDVFDASYQPVSLTGAFVDAKISAGFAPYGIANVNGRIVVTYAQQNATHTAAVAGQGLGFVDVFDTDGVLLSRVATRGQLNAPWGIAVAPAGLGDLAGQLLIGNQGSGEILTFQMSDDMLVFKPEGVLRDAQNKPIALSGLHGIQAGNGAGAGPSDTLYFVAGVSVEQGVLGRIQSID